MLWMLTNWLSTQKGCYLHQLKGNVATPFFHHAHCAAECSFTQHMCMCCRCLKQTIDVKDDRVANKIGLYIQKMANASTRARSLYEGLLTDYSTAPYLGEFYARFCTDVLNDPERAANYSHTIGDNGTVGKMSAARSAASKSSGSVSSFHTGRVWIPNTRVTDLKCLTMQLKFGVLALLLLVIASSVFYLMLANNTESDVNFLGQLSSQPYYVASAG